MAEFADAQVLSAEAFNVLEANAEAVLSYEAFGMPVFRVTYDSWDGVMIHWSATLGWSIRAVTPAAGSFVVQIENPFGSGTWQTLATQAGLVDNTTYSGTADLSAVAPALVKGTPYRLRVRPTSSGIEVNRVFHYGSLPVDQGGYVWTAPGSLTDGTVWDAAAWNALINNLRYLKDLVAGPRAPTRAALGMVASSASLGPPFDARRRPDDTPWRGYFNHRLADNVAYQIGGWPAGPGDTNGGRANLTIVRVDPSTAPPTYGDWGSLGAYYEDPTPGLFAWGDDPPKFRGANRSGTLWIDGFVTSPPHKVLPFLGSISGATDNSGPPGSSDLTGIPRGEWLEIRLNRHDSSQVYTLIMEALFSVRGEPDLTGWTALSRLQHGDYVDGTSAVLANLVANLAELKTRCEGFPHLPVETGYDHYYWYRRGDILRWAGSDVVLHWTRERWPARGLSESTLRLGTSLTGEQFDLRGAGGLVPGGMYYLTGSGEVWGLELLDA